VIEHKTHEQLRAERAEVLVVLGMTLEQARNQWDDCGCCLINGNWDDFAGLTRIRDLNFLLGEDS